MDETTKAALLDLASRMEDMAWSENSIYYSKYADELTRIVNSS